jgi:hypothetical protein
MHSLATAHATFGYRQTLVPVWSASSAAKRQTLMSCWDRSGRLVESTKACTSSLPHHQRKAAPLSLSLSLSLALLYWPESLVFGGGPSASTAFGFRSPGVAAAPLFVSYGVPAPPPAQYPSNQPSVSLRLYRSDNVAKQKLRFPSLKSRPERAVPMSRSKSRNKLWPAFSFSRSSR